MSSPIIRSEDAPLDCTSSTVLDLCVRHQRQSPCPENSQQAINNNNNNISKLFTTDSDSSEDGLLNAMYTTAVASVWLNRDTSTSGSRPTRPFKAYMPKDPFLLGMETSPGVDSSSNTSDTYAEFRRRMLEHVRAANPPPGVTNTKMRRNMVSCGNGMVSTTAQDKDASYWEKRKKNNEAAKRSRDARRAKEDEIAIRAAYLEQENLKLKYEIATLRNETARLRCLLYN